MKRKSKIIITGLLIFAAVNLWDSQLAFASMGSGGGHYGGGVFDDSGHYGGGHGSGGGSGPLDWDKVIDEVIVPFIIGLVIFITWFHVGPYVVRAERFIQRLISGRIFSVFLKCRYGSDYLTTKSAVDPCFDLFTPRRTTKDFEKILADHHLQLRVNDGSLNDGFAQVYRQAQFLYKQLVRQRHADPNTDLSGLKRYLDPRCYRATVERIKIKVRNYRVDDTSVDSVKVEKYCFLDDHLILTKLAVQSRATEVQWSDYVIFGLTKNGECKIINLVYGEHFPLDGRKLNKDKHQRNARRRNINAARTKH